jgi:hypothetical protein
MPLSSRTVIPAHRAFPVKHSSRVPHHWATGSSLSSILHGNVADFDHAAWDERRRELKVVYEANLNGQRNRACEIMQV